MSQTPPDHARLRTTEARMRRALGLPADTPARTTAIHSTNATHGSHRKRHQFVRDGEVQVTFIRREHEPGAASFGGVRRSIQSRAAAKGRT
jgi:hypothetical protein